MQAPAATAVARPLLLTVAASVLDEVQVTCVVISWLVPSEYAPEAANCWVRSHGVYSGWRVSQIWKIGLPRSP